MEIKIFYNKNVAENANYYYDKAKKLKKKLPGVLKTIEITQKELDDLNKNYDKYLEIQEKQEIISKVKKQEWYDKFRHTKTSSGVLVVFGKDATSNEVIIRKYSKETDLIVHSEAPGSPFGIIRSEENQEVTKEDIEEAGQIVLCFSKQWSKGFGTGDFFCVKQEQVSKKAQSGEYLAKGSFMVRGDKQIFKNIPLKMGFGYYEEIIKIDNEGDDEQNENESNPNNKTNEIKYNTFFSGTEKACKKYCKKYILLEPGKDNMKKLNKDIKKYLKITVDDLPRYISSGSKIVKK